MRGEKLGESLCLLEMIGPVGRQREINESVPLGMAVVCGVVSLFVTGVYAGVALK